MIYNLQNETKNKMLNRVIFPSGNYARILYVRSAGKKIYLDVYTNIPGEYNDFIISAACLIGFSLQEPEEVDEAIPEGYSVKEFTL